jgi:hypothetical protein
MLLDGIISIATDRRQLLLALKEFLSLNTYFYYVHEFENPTINISLLNICGLVTLTVEHL